MRHPARLIAIVLCLAASAPAYYHFLRFASRVGPFQPVPEKFDLNALPGKTLPWFVVDLAGAELAPGDSAASLLSQLRAAANVWNEVESSDLRLAFGGFAASGVQQAGPSINVLFDEVPPGLVAMGGPTVRAAANPNLVPILKSVLIVSPELKNRPSWSEALFSTLVHEFGHAIGLQHTLTSGAMATAITRSTTRALPLSADDVAAVSLLYPRAAFLQASGTIAGRVTMNGEGVSLASVVAISPAGGAVSTLTNPDGTYRIEGLQQRGWFVYVHPLPPARTGQSNPADIVLPVDADNRPFQPSGPFDTVFYSPLGGVRDPLLAMPVQTLAGSVTQNINFAVRPRAAAGIHSVEAYAFPSGAAQKPAFLSPGMTHPFLVATGTGMVSSSRPVNGLRATVLGGIDLGVRSYEPAAAWYVRFDFDQRTLAVPSNQPRHLVLSSPTDLYVLPSAFYHVERPAPAITAVTPQGDGANRTVQITGTSFGPDTRITFDGVAAQIRQLESLPNNQMRVTVAPPPAAPGHRSAIAALNSDGQSSLFVPAEAQPFYQYPDAPVAAAAVSLSPAAVPAGVETVVQIDAPGVTFADGQVALGFGSSDIAVRRIWVAGPGRLLVNLQIAPGALAGFYDLHMINGLQATIVPSALQVQPAQPRTLWIASSIVSASTGSSLLAPGSAAVLTLVNAALPLNATAVSVVLNETRIPAASVNGSQISFPIPSGTPFGPAQIRVEVGGERSLPVGVAIDPPAPRILSAALLSGESRIARPSDVLVLTISGLPTGVPQVSVKFGLREGRVLQVEAEKGTIQVQLPDDSPIGEGIPLFVSIDRRTAEPFQIQISR